MKRIVLLIFAFCLFLPLPRVFAASNSAYQDYVFQFDQYRQLFNNFRIALGQYSQFNSLESQQAALDKAKLAIGQRDVVSRTYLLFLNEKLTENPGLISSEIQLYRTMITNEIGFLDQHSTMISSVSSIDDAQKTSEEFTKHYGLMISGMRQTIIGLQMGYLNFFAQKFEAAGAEAQTFINATRPQSTAVKQAALDRWLLEISNKRSLYQQKANAIRIASFKLTGQDQEQVRQFSLIQKDLNQARQYLIEGASFLSELHNALKYL